MSQGVECYSCLPKTAWPPTCGIRTDLAQYRELAAFAQFASDLDEATRKQLERGRRTVEVLKQPQYAPMNIADMAVTLFAVTRGYMDEIDVKRVLEFEKSLHSFVRQKFAALVSKMETTKDLDSESEKQLVAAIQEFKAAWV